MGMPHRTPTFRNHQNGLGRSLPVQLGLMAGFGLELQPAAAPVCRRVLTSNMNTPLDKRLVQESNPGSR